MENLRAKITNNDTHGDYQHPAAMVVELVDEQDRVVDNLTERGVLLWPINIITINDKGAIVTLNIKDDSGKIPTGTYDCEIASVNFGWVRA